MAARYRSVRRSNSHDFPHQVRRPWNAMPISPRGRKRADELLDLSQLDPTQAEVKKGRHAFGRQDTLGGNGTLYRL